MKGLLLVLTCLFTINSACCQSDTDSLMVELYRTTHSDSQFETFVMSNRRRVYSHPQAAYSLYRKIQILATERNLPKLTAVALDVQGIYFQNTGVFDSAEIRYREGLEIRQRLGQPTLVSQSYNNLGVLHRRKGQYDSALHYYRQALVVAEAAKDSTLMGDYLSNIGLVHQNQQDLENAIKYNLESLTIRQALRDTMKMAASFNNIGIIYNDLKNYKDAGVYLEKALAIKRAIGEHQPIANTLTNLGSTYYHLRDFAKAAEHLNEALTIYEALNDRQSSAAVLDDLSFVARQANDLSLSYDYSNRALAIRTDLGHRGDIIHSSTNTARILIDLGRLKEATILLDTAYKLARDFREIGPLKAVAQMKAHLYETAGDYRRAYQFYVEHAVLKDSLLNESTLSRIAELREQYESTEKERELQLQEARLLQQEAVIVQRSQQRNFVMVLAGAILLIFILVFFSYRARLSARDALSRKATEMEQMRSHFFANISHEFRTPLTLIQSIADELQERDVEPQMVKTVSANTGRLLQLVDQLLDLSRVDAGRLKITARPCDVSRFIRAIAASFVSLSAQKGIRYEMIVADPIDGYLDADKLEKIIVNLLANAFKFTPRDGLIELRAQSDGGTLSLTVSDTGSGIPKGEQERIFNRFYQTPGNQHHGAGIGLSLTRELVELQGGTIIVESTEGKGTRFQVILPLSHEAFLRLGANILETEEEFNPTFVPETSERNAPKKVLIRGNKYTALIVEDNPDLRDYVKQILSEEYDVLEARNGKEGLEVAEKILPDIIVTDIMMPVMDGVAFCEKLKTSILTSHIPVILLTAKASEDDKLQGLSIGADDYLVKPFSKRELRARIHNLVQQREKLIAKFSRSLNPREIKLNSSDEAFVKRLRDIIEIHLDDSEFSVNQLSLEIGMSRTQLFRKVQALTGFSVSEFMRVVRLNYAAEMLKNKTGSISEIAYRVGFNNLSYFAKCFKARFGTTPGNFS